MKFEERIIELLAEYLRKTDRALEKLTIHDELFKRNDEKFERHMAAVAEQMLDFRKAIIKGDVERKVLLEEIFRISKRVQNVEERQNKR